MYEENVIIADKLRLNFKIVGCNCNTCGLSCGIRTSIDCTSTDNKFYYDHLFDIIDDYIKTIYKECHKLYLFKLNVTDNINEYNVELYLTN